MSRQVTMRFHLEGDQSGTTIIQTVVLEDDTISIEDFIAGLNKKEFITTICHERGDLDNYEDAEVLNSVLKRVGYVKSQDVDDHAAYEEFELLDSVNLED